MIEHLPLSFDKATQGFLLPQKIEYQRALEADVINLLIGPLAEAKYVALRDDEVFNANLVYMNALSSYGERYDLKLIDEYINCLISNDETARNKKLADLFLSAYSFVNDRNNWLAITTLAENIYNYPENKLPCEKVITILDSVLNPTANAITLQSRDKLVAFPA